MSTHFVFLTTPSDTQIKLELQKTAPGQYELIGAEGVDLAAHTLCFSLNDLGSDVTNLDLDSDSISCFDLSEHVQTPELEVAGRAFKAANLSQVQSGLNRLRGDFADNDDY